MTPEEFKEVMQAIVEMYKGDLEIMHTELDKAMCRMLWELGYTGGVEVFNKQDLWYA